MVGLNFVSQFYPKTNVSKSDVIREGVAPICLELLALPLGLITHKLTS